MEVRFDKLSKLTTRRLEKLLGWQIQRQLRWAVILVTDLVALLQLYFQIKGYFSGTNIVDSIDSHFWGLVVIIGFVMFVLWVCEGRAIDYYYYVGKIEEIWAIKQKEVKMERNEIFTPVGKRFDNFVMRCPSNAKWIIRLTSMFAVIASFLLPPLF